jgi:hypothetical protein
MAKGSKRKVPLAARKDTRRNAKKNPFESWQSSRTHSDALGRNLAPVKSINVARSDAVERVWCWTLQKHVASTRHWVFDSWPMIANLSNFCCFECDPLGCINLCAAASFTKGLMVSAVLQRRKSLLIEYKQLKKANAFVDRRFGGTFFLS